MNSSLHIEHRQSTSFEHLTLQHSNTMPTQRTRPFELNEYSEIDEHLPQPPPRFHVLQSPLYFACQHVSTPAKSRRVLSFSNIKSKLNNLKNSLKRSNSKASLSKQPTCHREISSDSLNSGFVQATDFSSLNRSSSGYGSSINSMSPCISNNSSPEKCSSVIFSTPLDGVSKTARIKRINSHSTRRHSIFNMSDIESNETRRNISLNKSYYVPKVYTIGEVLDNMKKIERSVELDEDEKMCDQEVEFYLSQRVSYFTLDI